jgi:UDP-N-acetylglucosamine pyrophosphorylase
MVIPAQAATDESGLTSENNTNTLTKLLPDIETIYHDALTMPFIKAQSKIYDKDIAEYYQALMDKTGLTQ